jgi:hypothetical protein
VKPVEIDALLRIVHRAAADKAAGIPATKVSQAS